jgi:hypothetical protein
MNTKIIICRDCGKEIEITNTSKKILCEECKQKSFKSHFKNFIEQKILCRRPECNNIVKIITKKGGKTKDILKGSSLCDSCRKKGRYDKVKQIIRCTDCGNIIKINIVSNNKQLKIEKYKGLCDSCRKKHEEIFLKKTSNRMKRSNPMKRSEIAEKVSNTILRKIKSGEITYPRGKDHYLYKGTRIFGQSCRLELYHIWTKYILERDNFRCTLCGSKFNLQVHHIKPLREIIKEIFKKYNLDYNNSYFTREKYGDKLFDTLKQEVLNEHTLDIGITVCKQCHSDIDPYYKI